MTNPFQHPFLTRDKTMYLSTLSYSTLIQPNKTLKLPSRIFENLVFLKMIFKAQNQKNQFLNLEDLTIFHYPLMFNLFRIRLKQSKKLQIHFILMILKAQNLKQIVFELNVLLIHFVQDIYFPQPRHLYQIMEEAL